MDELELQYLWMRSPGKALARMPERLGDLRLVEVDEITVCDTYLDTPDAALAAAGERLRIRDAGHGAELTRKGRARAAGCSRGRLRARIEQSVPLRDAKVVRAARRAFPAIAPLIGGGPLVELGNITNRRTRYFYGRKGRLDVEVTLDRLTYSSGGPVEYRIEAEAMTPQGEKRLADLAGALEAALGRGLVTPTRGKVRELLHRTRERVPA